MLGKNGSSRPLLLIAHQVGPGKRLLAFMAQMIQLVDSANKAALRGGRTVSAEEAAKNEDL